jgi:hypothetical protein
MFVYIPFSIQGQANSVVYDTGIESTEKEKKILRHIIISCSAHAGNHVELWVEKTMVASVPDYLLDTRALAGTTAPPLSTTKMNMIEVGLALEVGQRARLALRCGANATAVDGCYVYEVTK